MNQSWSHKTLGSICTFSNGLWKGKKPPFVNVGIIRNTNFTKDCKLDTSDIAYHDVEVSQLAKRQLQKGDLILEKSGGGPNQPVGRVVLFDCIEGQFSFSNFTSVIRVKDCSTISPKFLHRCLYYYYVSGATESMQRRSTGIRNLTFEAYKQLPIPLPPLAEQKRIVAILDEAFAAIERAKEIAQKNIANARELFEACLEKLFIERGHEWCQESLDKLVQDDSPITYGVVKPGADGNVPFIRGGDLRDGVVLKAQLRTISQDVSAQYRRTLLKGGELLVCLVGVPGQTGVVPPDLANANIARQVGLVRLRKEISPEFVSYFLLSRSGKKRLGAYTGGSVQQVINLADLKKVKVPLPNSLGEQIAIVTEINSAKETSENLGHVTKLRFNFLDTLKQSILHKAFTGQLTAKSPELEAIP